MSFFFNSAKTKKIYWNGTKVKKLFWNGVKIFSSGTLLASCYHDNALYFTEDANTFEQVSTYKFSAKRVNDLWLGIYDGGIWYSEDGKEWHDSNVPSYSELGIGSNWNASGSTVDTAIFWYYDDKYWFGGYNVNGTFTGTWTSSDGIHWNKVAISETYNKTAFKVKFRDNECLACYRTNDSEGSSNVLLRLRQNQSDIISTFTGRFFDVEHSNKFGYIILYALIGSGGFSSPYYQVSSDGSNWNVNPFITSGNITRNDKGVLVNINGNIIVTVWVEVMTGRASIYGAISFITADGVTFQKAPCVENTFEKNGIIYGGSNSYLAENASIAISYDFQKGILRKTSDDGFTWEIVYGGDADYEGIESKTIVHFKDKFIGIFRKDGKGYPHQFGLYIKTFDENFTLINTFEINGVSTTQLMDMGTDYGLINVNDDYIITTNIGDGLARGSETCTYYKSTDGINWFPISMFNNFTKLEYSED